MYALHNCSGAAQRRQLGTKHAHKTHHNTCMTCEDAQPCPHKQKMLESKTALSASCHCTQGTKKMYRKPLFRGNSSADPDDIRSPRFNDCVVPLVWWPWWPENPSDFFLTSVAPFHAMLHAGVVDKNVKYTPVMEGLKQPGYFQWYFDPITNFPVSFLLCFGG